MTLSRRRKLAYSLVPGLVSIALALVAGEVWLRRRYAGIEQITGATEWQTGQWKGLTYFWDQYHPRLGWTNLQGYRSDARVPFALTINGQGLRAAHDYSQEPAPGRTRIAMFGDSCTFGEEVDDDETLPHHLEQRLVDAEVLNFGVHGYGLGQMVLRLEDEGLAFHPARVVIVLLIPLDITRDPLDQFTHNKPRFGVEGEELRITNVPVPEASRQPWLFRHSYAAAWLFDRPPGVPAPGENLGQLLKLSRALLRRAGDACAARSIPLSLVLIVNGTTIDAAQQDPALAELIGRIRAALADAGVDVVDVVAELTDYHRRTGGRQMARLGHWRSDANRFIADLLARRLVAADPALRLR